jgi:hypothetical protein
VFGSDGLWIGKFDARMCRPREKAGLGDNFGNGICPMYGHDMQPGDPGNLTHLLNDL